MNHVGGLCNGTVGDLPRRHVQSLVNYSKIEHSEYVFTGREGVNVAIKVAAAYVEI